MQSNLRSRLLLSEMDAHLAISYYVQEACKAGSAVFRLKSEADLCV